MSAYAICIVQPPGFFHSEAFREVGELLLHGLRRLDHDAILSDNADHQGRQAIVLGSCLLPPQSRPLPGDAILYNLEQIYPGSPWLSPHLLELFRRHAVWDYSARNAARYAELGLPRPRVVPIGHVPELVRIPRSPERDDIDVLFYGSLNERRQAILDALRARGLRVEAVFGVYGEARDRLIARSKIVLNLHFYEAKVFEIVRVSYLLANGRCVVSERGADPAEEHELEEGVAFADYGELVNTCARLVSDPAARARLREAGQAIMTRRDEVAYLREALAPARALEEASGTPATAARLAPEVVHSETMLRENLAALAKNDPELAERLCWPVGDDLVRPGPDGALLYAVGKSSLPLTLSPERARRSLAEAGPRGEAVFLFGLGLGEIATTILADVRRTRVVAWERDPWLMRLALERNDWRRDLASGRLRLLLGTDLIEEARRRPKLPVIAHPLLGQVYATESAMLEGNAGRPVAMLCAGGLFVRDLGRALSRSGFAPFTLDLQRLSREELSRSVRRLRPALVASINYTEGLAEFCAEHHTKLLCWEIDPCTSALPPCRLPTDEAFIFTYRRAAVEEYRAAGFRNVEHLPLATDPERRQSVEPAGDEEARYRASVSIVAASMVPEVPRHERSFLDAWKAYRGGDPRAEAEGTRVLERVLEEQARDDSRYRVPEILERGWPDFAQAAGPGAARSAGEVAAALKRLSCGRRLARFGVRIWGDEGWRQIEGDGATYQGPAGHEHELAKVYCGSAVNVDLGRLYQMDIVTMRVFDALACGAFVLAERSDDLGSLFDVGVEVDCWATPRELLAKVAHYLAHPQAARDLALRGREAVLQRHTIQARVAHMLRVAGC